MNGKIFIDSSAWIAYSFQKEIQHKDFVQLINQANKSKSILYTSNDVIDETYTRLRYYVGWHIAKKFIDYFHSLQRSKFLIQLWTNEKIQSEAFRLLNKFNDHDLSLTDATSTTLMHNSGIITILTTDYKHFTTLGFRVLPQPK